MVLALFVLCVAMWLFAAGLFSCFVLYVVLLLSLVLLPSMVITLLGKKELVALISFLGFVACELLSWFVCSSSFVIHHENMPIYF